MLSRTAANLYWLARFMERADSLSRIIDAAQRLATMPQQTGATTNEWQSAVATAGCAAAFKANYPRADARTVTEFLAFSPANPASIKSCVETARTNARAVRTALTGEMWDSINSAWYEVRRFDPNKTHGEDLARFLSLVKESSLRFDGAAFRTMLRNDAYCFSRLGILLERADATARILDVKYHVLLPEQAQVGGPLDYFQWVSILRSVSARASYHWVYRDSVKPWLVADLLILNRQMPRSLASCYENMSRYLDDLAQFYGRQGNSQRIARSMLTKLSNASMEDIFQSGLHEFINSFIADNNRLGEAITEQYLV
jgi:uncharacterized alpha-E superfamily protein